MNIQNTPVSKQWKQAVVRAHDYCASIGRKGGSPKDAVRSYGLFKLDSEPGDWENAEIIIALAMCRPGPLPH